MALLEQWQKVAYNEKADRGEYRDSGRDTSF